MSSKRKARTLTVAAPDPDVETLVPFFDYAPVAFKRELGQSPGRYTLSKYVNGPGFTPKRASGLYIIAPTVTRMHRRYTSAEAMSRFFTKVRAECKKMGVPLYAAPSTRRRRRRESA